MNPWAISLYGLLQLILAHEVVALALDHVVNELLVRLPPPFGKAPRPFPPRRPLGGAELRAHAAAGREVGVPLAAQLRRRLSEVAPREHHGLGPTEEQPLGVVRQQATQRLRELRAVDVHPAAGLTGGSKLARRS